MTKKVTQAPHYQRPNFDQDRKGYDQLEAQIEKTISDCDKALSVQAIKDTPDLFLALTQFREACLRDQKEFKRWRAGAEKLIGMIEDLEVHLGTLGPLQ